MKFKIKKLIIIIIFELKFAYLNKKLSHSTVNDNNKK